MLRTLLALICLLSITSYSTEVDIKGIVYQVLEGPFYSPAANADVGLIKAGLKTKTDATGYFNLKGTVATGLFQAKRFPHGPTIGKDAGGTALYDLRGRRLFPEPQNLQSLEIPLKSGQKTQILVMIIDGGDQSFSNFEGESRGANSKGGKPLGKGSAGNAFVDSIRIKSVSHGAVYVGISAYVSTLDTVKAPEFSCKKDSSGFAMSVCDTGKYCDPLDECCRKKECRTEFQCGDDRACDSLGRCIPAQCAADFQCGAKKVCSARLCANCPPYPDCNTANCNGITDPDGYVRCVESATGPCDRYPVNCR